PCASQPVHILVGYAAGGGVDIVARLLQEPMKAALGQPIIIENRTGASAMLATGAVAKAPPDGYMLLMAASGEVAINHFLFKEKMAYDPVKELVPVAMIGSVPCVVVVADATPVRNPKELIAYAKTNPGKLSFSSSGIGNPQQLAGELMNSMAGIQVLHVPYRGSAPAVTHVATGPAHCGLLAPRRGVAVDAGRQDPRNRGHLARTDAEIARRCAVERRRARPCGLRIAQLVRDVRHRRYAARDRRASQFHREHGAQGSGYRRQIAAAGHRAEADEARRAQGFRRCRAHEIRKDCRAGQYQIEQLIYRPLVLSSQCIEGSKPLVKLCRLFIRS